MEERSLCGYHLNCVAVASQNLLTPTTTTTIATHQQGCDHRSKNAPSFEPRPSPPTPPHPHYHHHRHQHRPHTKHQHWHQSHAAYTERHISLSSSHLKLLFLIVISLLTSASAQQTCTNSDGCFPPVGNLALGRPIRVNSTCMNNELFCLLLTSDCMQCSEALHSTSSLNDNDNSTFWVSDIGTGTRQVALQLDFERAVSFQDMTLVWQSVRPYVMTLERSCDFGETWSVYRYYAADCALAFMMEHTSVGNGVQPFNGTTPICTNSQTELFSFDFGFSVVSCTEYLNVLPMKCNEQ